MLSRKGIMVLVLLTGPSGPALAQFDPVYSEGVDALYSLDFSTAETRFEELTKTQPGNPHFWNAVATAQWLKIVYGQEKLNLESFSGSGLGTRDSKDIVRPEDEQRLRSAVARAIAVADGRLRANARDVEALYARGVAIGTLAAFEAVVKRSYLGAHGKAKEARSLHSEVLKIDPQFRDARLAIGVYEYTVGAIPRWLRFFLGVFGVGGGSKESGIAAIEDAMRNGRRTSTDARMLLTVVYNRERRFEDALRVLVELHARYPRNYLFELAQASTLGKAARWDDAVRVYRSVIDKAEARRDGYERLAVAKVLLMQARASIDARQFENALDQYTRAALHQSATEDDRATAHLWAGKIHDSGGRRAQAVAQYQSVLQLKCDPRLRDEAGRYVKRPWRGE